MWNYRAEHTRLYVAGRFTEHYKLTVCRSLQTSMTIVDSGVYYHMHFQVSSLDQCFAVCSPPAEKALREQESLIQSHIDVLMARLHTEINSPNNGVVDMVSSLGCNPR